MDLAVSVCCRRFALTFGLTTLAVRAAFAFDLASADLSELPQLVIRTEHDEATFLVVAPEAQMSLAWRDPTDFADKAGVIPAPIGPYQLFASVIVESNSTNLGPALETLGASPTGPCLPVVPGFMLVPYRSVVDAASVVEEIRQLPNVEDAYMDVSRPKILRSPSDPEYWRQWHLYNAVLPIADLNVEPVWNAGLTGAGVTIGIVEYGWQVDHPDLAANFHSAASQTGFLPNSHGTSVAGLAAAASNSVGGVGVAYGARLSAQVIGSSAQNAAAFSFRNDLNAVKSSSWGPPDNGQITYMSSLERAALAQGVAAGRAGRGEVYFWAAGNGGTLDRMDYDPYASCAYVFPVGAIGDLDSRSYYSEVGAAMLAVAPSSGNTRRIFTTAGGSGYTTTFGGTSAAAPSAAGVVALMLQANPELTWRDVEHILVQSARRPDPLNPDWVLNGAGRRVSYSYGFGAIDAAAAVALAQDWVSLGAPLLDDSGVISLAQPIPDNSTAGTTIAIEMVGALVAETAEVTLNISTTYVGDLRVVLTSPRGTESILAEPRDDPQDNYANFVFATRRCFDERAFGTWTLRISDLRAGDAAVLNSVRLNLTGRPVPPVEGDVNCDGEVNNSDIDAFILALTNLDYYRLQYPDCPLANADLNGDQAVDNADVDPFVRLLSR